MNLTKPVAPTLRRYLVAFDGTWNREKDEDGVERFYAAYTADPRYDVKYYAGVGNAQDHKDGGGQLFHGAIGQFDANAIVDRAYNETVAFYQDPAHRTTPLDIVGFSRGAFQATKFATMISSGLTDNTRGKIFGYYSIRRADKPGRHDEWCSRPAALRYDQKLWTVPPATQAAFLTPSTKTMPSITSCSFSLLFRRRQPFSAF